MSRVTQTGSAHQSLSVFFCSGPLVSDHGTGLSCETHSEEAQQEAQAEERLVLFLLVLIIRF